VACASSSASSETDWTRVAPTFSEIYVDALKAWARSVSRSIPWPAPGRQGPKRFSGPPYSIASNRAEQASSHRLHSSAQIRQCLWWSA
jgi:hypothetical protein